MYNFNEVHNRENTGCVKWDKQLSFGVEKGLLPFWIADTEFYSLPEITEFIKKRCEHQILGYSEQTKSCLEAIQGWYERRHNWKIDTETMVLSVGVVTSLWFTLRTLTNSKDKVLVFTPVYDPFFEIIKNTKRELVESPLKEENGKYNIDFDDFEAKIKTGVKAIILCNPHNPVGRVWTYDEIKKIVEICSRYSVYILSDEIHGDITFDLKYTTLGRFIEEYDKIIVYTAISKTFNMAGLISSCIMIPNNEIREKIRESIYNSWIFGPNVFAYIAIEAAYTYGDKWVDEQNHYLKENVKFLKEFINKNMPKIKLIEPEGTFLVWLDFRNMNLTSDEITKILADKYKIALGNGAHYGKEADGFMRLNIGCSKSMLEKGLNILKQFYLDYIESK